jgi:hypothetical protein
MICNKEPDHQLYLCVDRPHHIKFHYLHFHTSKVLFQALPAYHVTYGTASLNHPTIVSPGSLFHFQCDSSQIKACIAIIIIALSDFSVYQ